MQFQLAGAGPQADRHPDAHTAEHHLLRAVPRARSEDTVASVIDRMRLRHYESATAVYILDESRRLVGLVPMPKLLAAGADCAMADIMRTHPPAVHVGDDQERVATVAVHHGIPAVPVVDESRQFLGVVPPAAIIRILRQEHVEDLHRLAGIVEQSAHLYSSMETAPLRRARDRLPWLLVGLLGSMIATLVMAQFEATLQARIAVAFFVPAIVYLADAIGTQTEAITVRGLSLTHLSLRALLAGELTTGLLIGLTLGLIAFPLVALAFGDARLALAVSAAILTAGAVASSVGLFFPWLLHRFGFDPALGSGPVATIIQDVLSLLIYFLIATSLVV